MEHPITPTSELAQQWYDSIPSTSRSWKQELATQAARWGADQQLKAVCMWLAQETPLPYIAALRAAMRPKPPSLAEQALTKIDAILGDPQKSTLKDELEALELSRAALERLQELEKGND